MVNINFNQILSTLDNQPVLDAKGQPLTLGAAAIQLLTAHVPGGAPDALTALELAEQIQKNNPMVTLMFPGFRVLEAAVTANSAGLSALVLAQVARRLGIKGA